MSPLTFTEQLAVDSAKRRVARGGAQRPAVAARTELSLVLGRSKSKRRAELVRLVLADA